MHAGIFEQENSVRRIEDFERFVSEFLNGKINDGETITRSQLHEWLSGCGYADRTVNNMLYPSRPDGMIAKLIEYGVLKSSGVKRWVFCGKDSLDKSKKIASEKVTVKKERVVFYEGKPNNAKGWGTHTHLADDGYGSDWGFSAEEFRSGDYNLKVFCMGRYPRKANYWLSYIGGKLSGRDYDLLKENHPKLVENLIDDLSSTTFVACR